MDLCLHLEESMVLQCLCDHEDWLLEMARIPLQLQGTVWLVDDAVH